MVFVHGVVADGENGSVCLHHGVIRREVEGEKVSVCLHKWVVLGKVFPLDFHFQQRIQVGVFQEVISKVCTHLDPQTLCKYERGCRIYETNCGRLLFACL